MVSIDSYLVKWTCVQQVGVLLCSRLSLPNIILMKEFVLLGVLVALSCSLSISNSHFWELDNNLEVSFTYFAKKDKPLSTSIFCVYWNMKSFCVHPSNYDATIVKRIVTARPGWNELRFVGYGNDSSSGAEITNVQLKRESVCHSGVVDYIKNGNFSEGNDAHDGWKNFESGITGWLGSSLKLGYRGQTPQGLKNLPRQNNEFEYAAFDHIGNNTQEPLNSSRFSVSWNGRKLADITPTNYSIFNASFTFTAQYGLNNLTFEGNQLNNNKGVGITNVRINRGSMNLIKNGNFDMLIHQDTSYATSFTNPPGWVIDYQFNYARGNYVNSVWGERRIAQLSSVSTRGPLKQELRFDGHYRLMY